MALAGVATAMAAAGVLVTGGLALIFARDPERALELTTHRREALPLVMADRYAAMAFLALGAALWGRMEAIAWLFAAFAFTGFADAVIYARSGQAWSRHATAGGAALAVCLVALAALGAGG